MIYGFFWQTILMKYHTFFIRKLGNMSEKLSSDAGCDLKLCDFKAKLWSSIHVPVQLPCGGSRLLQRRGTVFAFRLCGPGSIPTLSGWDFSAPCNTRTG